MQVDSKPEELDALDRDILQKQIEVEALKLEDDAASKTRLAALEKSLADLQERSGELNAQWQAERDKLASAREALRQGNFLRSPGQHRFDPCQERQRRLGIMF